MRFFHPSRRLRQWLARRCGKRIVFDVGAGDGDLVIELQALGIKCVGIEPHWFDRRSDRVEPRLTSSMLPQFAQQCSLLKTTENSVVLFCRPCHGPQFVQEVLEVLPASAEVLYITAPDNLGRDFDLGAWSATPLKTPKTAEGEIIYLITRKE